MGAFKLSESRLKRSLRRRIKDCFFYPPITPTIKNSRGNDDDGDDNRDDVRGYFKINIKVKTRLLL